MSNIIKAGVRKVALTWAGVTTTDTSPDVDIEIDCLDADTICIHCTDSGTAADWNLNIHGLQVSGGTPTTDPITAKNGGADETIQLDITPGTPFIVLRADENGADTAVLAAKVTVTYKKK